MLNIEGDNVTVIRTLQGTSKGPWQISHVIQDIKACLHQDIQVTIYHTFREANMAADWLSKFTHSITNTFITDTCLSPTFRQILTDDCIGRQLILFSLLPRLKINK